MTLPEGKDMKSGIGETALVVIRNKSDTLKTDRTSGFTPQRNLQQLFRTYFTRIYILLFF